MANRSSSALFEQYADARAALQELRRHFAFRVPGVQVKVHSVKTPSSELSLAETDLRSGFLTGAVWGIVGGLIAALGAFISEEEGWIPPNVATIVFSASAGLILGLLGGGLIGSTNPKMAFEQLKTMAHDKGVVITVVAKTKRDRVAAEQILKKHAGHTAPPISALPVAPHQPA